MRRRGQEEVSSLGVWEEGVIMVVAAGEAASPLEALRFLEECSKELMAVCC